MSMLSCSEIGFRNSMSFINSSLYSKFLRIIYSKRSGFEFILETVKNLVERSALVL